ncbi:MAG: hypothetical protein ABJN69_08220 [Hellea sp.]
MFRFDFLVRAILILLIAVIGLSACQPIEAIFTAPESTFDKDADVGPLGVEMGMTKKSFSSLREVDYNFYQTDYVPRQSSLFDFYNMKFAPDGLCALIGVGRDVETTKNGEMLRREYTRVYQALSKKYGMPADEYDSIVDKAKFPEDENWMKAIEVGERSYEAHWQETSSNVLPHNLESISLRSRATDEVTGYIVIRYEFDNYSACEEMDKARELEDL